MFAVIESGGKQYKVAKNDVITVEKLSAEVGANVDLGRVLLLGGDGGTVIGTPAVDGASVTAEVLDQTRGDKIIVFKKKRRKNYRRKQGHRQDLTVLRITEISPGGATTAKPEAKAAEAAPAAESKPKAKPKAETKAKPATEAKAETKKKAPAKKRAAKPKAAAEGETKAKPKAKRPAAKKAEEKD